MEPGLWSLGCGALVMDPRLWSLVVDPGLWSLGCGALVVEPMLWSLS